MQLRWHQFLFVTFYHYYYYHLFLILIVVNSLKAGYVNVGNRPSKFLLHSQIHCNVQFQLYMRMK